MATMSRSVASVGDLVTPGTVVGALGKHTAGRSVYASGSLLHATIVGVVREESAGSSTPVRSVDPPTPQNVPLLPKVGDVVTARVVKVTPRAAHCELLVCDGVPVVESFKGTIRQQDVRQTQIDSVVLYSCFRPGDIVSAEVMSFGDKHAYFLTTAKNEYGVVQADGPGGVPMLPISWEEMQCPKTKVKQARKVAKQ